MVGNPGIQAIGSWARYLRLGTEAEDDGEQSRYTGYWQLGKVLRLTTSNPDIQAIGSWAGYPGLGTLA